MIRVKASEKKEKLMKEFRSTPLKIGETVEFISNENGKYRSGKVVKIENGIATIKRSDYDYFNTVPVDLLHRSITTIGADPFSSEALRISTVNYDMESIVFNLDLLECDRRERKYDIDGIKLKEVSFDPFVIIDGEKKYFQRPFVWTLEENQLLIDSIYNDVSCGTVLILKKSWEELEVLAKAGETELAFNSVIDGKQRLNALQGFINCKYADSKGNYYSDLSTAAQLKFCQSKVLSYKEVGKCTDKQVLQEFLKVNFSGVPQSRDHIDFVKGLYENIQGK